MKRNIYGITEDNKKIKIGEYDDGLYYVGGKIFYIDSNSDETVEFYDAQKNLLSNVAVGDSPVYYKVTNAGTGGKEKYYIYDNTTGLLAASRLFGYYGITTGATNQGIGAGKLNTSLILAISNPPSSNSKLFVNLATNNTNKVGGCDDWYVGSRDEIDQFRLSGLETFGNFTWPISSEEISDKTVYAYTGAHWESQGKNSANYGCFFIRSF